ncbi:hypothetical protein DR64_525 [Paraburkholderia xenovorans LB400]|uniref:Lipoprotein n=1 Tax=Paraburkholderia xenovorans (strain LB400) TaxID=266265 RepID=Q140W9_PARXL|nr:hypothetical protein [Paraburkholderia xenovorans]ABE30120.1 hypothetical protein Bxe_A2843 [Paraburkholderia xenovorans LB400]AIP31250.1 hypothetical protein DR64_525 [Paraburkholderia xenovorans LB400]
MRTLTAGILFTFAFTAGCAPAHYVTTGTPDYDPRISARVRIKSGNDQQAASFRVGACYSNAWESDPQRVNVDDGFMARYKYSSRSVVIGMPPSPRPWMRVEGLRFKDMIREYVIPAGQPITLALSTAGDAGGKYGGYSWSCKPHEMTFTPIAGQDYDAYLLLQDEGRRAPNCSIEVRHIDASGLDEPVETQYASRCPSSGTETAPKRGP